MQYDTTLTTDELERTIAAIEPEWHLRDANATEAGHHAVYRLEVETSDGRRECFLKATPAGKDPTVHTEARLLAVIGEHAAMPVPTVYGAVDEHDGLLAPFHLTEAMPGEVRSRMELAAMDADTLQSIARDVGRYLAELHAIDAVETFGFLTADGPTLRGEAPSGDPDTVAVADPTADWQACLHDWADDTLANVAETRFADVVPEAEPVLREQIDALAGPFDPVLARVDHALENALVEDDRLTAMLDWEFTLAATPAYDVCCVEWSLAGGPYLFVPEVPDRRDLVREAVLAGYRELAVGGGTEPRTAKDRSGAAPGAERVAAQVAANRACYDLLAALRSMVLLEDWFELFDLDTEIDAAAAELRQEVARRR